MYRAEGITKTRTKDGKIVPQSPCGIAVPQGWELIEKDGQVYYVREQPRTG